MAVAAKLSNPGDAVAIKVSSKNQITIPAAACKKYEFGDYALCTFTEDGILIQPFEPANGSEELSYKLFQYLIDSGFEGDDLVAKYEEIKPLFLDFTRLIQEGVQDIDEGRVNDYAEMREELRSKYGV